MPSMMSMMVPDGRKRRRWGRRSVSSTKKTKASNAKTRQHTLGDELNPMCVRLLIGLSSARRELLTSNSGHAYPTGTAWRFRSKPVDPFSLRAFSFFWYC